MDVKSIALATILIAAIIPMFPINNAYAIAVRLLWCICREAILIEMVMMRLRLII